MLSIPTLEGLKVFINGELAAVGDQPTKGYTIIRSSPKHIGFRKKGGWKYGDVFIQASVGHNRSIEQRVFISGSSIPNVKPDKPLISRVSDYVFSLHDRDFEVDFEVPDNSTYAVINGQWFMVCCFKGYTVFHAEDGYSKRYDMDMRQPHISKCGLISMVLTNSSTAHSHVNYRASNSDSWLPTMRLEGPGFDRFIFTDWGEHYWISEKRMVVRHSVNPFSGESMDMLWKDHDLEVFSKVIPTKKNHCLINDRFVVNTRFPEIYPWSR